MSSKILTKLLNILIGLTLIILLFQVGFAQTNPVNNTFTIKSAILGEDQKVFVYLPKDYEKSEAKYPVVYLLDGEYNFSFTADAVKTLSSWTNRMPSCIVIGITSNNRDRDLTTIPDKSWQPPQPIPAAGGANNFLDYIEKELIPYVDKNYRTQPLRTIIGHSLGGLFAVNALSVKPDLFRFYILLDSSIWWDDGRVAKRAMSYLTSHPNYNGRIAWIRDKIPHEVWFDINTEFLAFLENKRPAGLLFTFTELENETHSSLVFPGTYFGLREIFSDFAFKFEEKTDLAAVQKHYRKLSENYGYSVSIPEQIYNNLSGQLIYLKNFKDAIAAGEAWVKDYPKSSSAYETLGKAYLENGNKELAINSLKKSIELNPENPRAKELLKQVEK
ncbi:MAG: tetratricopeptide repeat protein [Pyrinomonadaceae bacterium]|nr:tetratricopeptide repeat protein [Pyrinomonadaceae bacterium]